jgi:hypothetical protein
MIVLINGSFGVGKTTVAYGLRDALSGSVVYDPEWVGFMLMRLPDWLSVRGSGTDDFQDLAMWRRSVVAGTRLARAVASGPVIVPMAFTRLDYFTEIISGIRQFEPLVKAYCLRASVSTIQRRLAQRGTPDIGLHSEWMLRRVPECVAAHEDARFGEAVDTEGRGAGQVVDDLLERLSCQNDTPN